MSEPITPLVIGKWKTQDAVAALREIGANEKADELEQYAARSMAEPQGGFADFFAWLFETPAYLHTTHRVGYLPPVSAENTEPIDIRDAETIPCDKSLIGARINISLLSLRAYNYPGQGIHNVLFNFTARNQVTDTTEEPVAFNLKARVQEGEQAGVINYMIFDGLKVGLNGVALEGKTVNVHNADDERFLETLESEAFKQGLKLLETAQPVIQPFTQLGVQLAKSMGNRNRNITVQGFRVGLDFSNQPLTARLKEGVYLIVQAPERLEFQDWIYLPTQRTIVKKVDRTIPLPLNFVAISIRRHG